jgi:hypothetical protein
MKTNGFLKTKNALNRKGNTVFDESTSLLIMGGGLMKRVVLHATIIGMTSIFAIVAPNAQAGDEHECRLATLNDTYAFMSTGRLADDVPVANVGVFTFDGRGSIYVDATTSRGGVFARTVGTGTYSVNSDCTGSWTLFLPDPPFQSDANFVIIADGSELMWIRTNPGTTVTAFAKQQFRHDNRGQGK